MRVLGALVLELLIVDVVLLSRRTHQIRRHGTEVQSAAVSSTRCLVADREKCIVAAPTHLDSVGTAVPAAANPNGRSASPAKVVHTLFGVVRWGQTVGSEQDVGPDAYHSTDAS